MKIMLSHENQKKHIGMLYINGGFEFIDTFFPYTSGKIGPYFVQSAGIMRRGTDFFEAIRDMSYLVSKQINPNDEVVISGGEKRDWIFSMPVATNLMYPHSMLCKDGKILGADMNEMNVFHVADLNNNGSSPRNMWIPMIKKAGGDIQNIFFYVDRFEEGVKVIQDIGLRSDSLIQLDGHAWDYLKSIYGVGEDIYFNLMERMEDRDAWAREMLRSDRGLTRLAEIYQKTPDKAIKILNVGYPDLREELSQRLAREKGIVIYGS